MVFAFPAKGLANFVSATQTTGSSGCLDRLCCAGFPFPGTRHGHQRQGFRRAWPTSCTGVLKEFDFSIRISLRGCIFRRVLLLDSGLLGNAGVSFGCLYRNRQRPMESCSPWSDLCPEGTPPNPQSQPGWDTHVNGAVCPAGWASFGRHPEMPEFVRKKQSTQNTFRVEDPPWGKVTGHLVLIWRKMRLLLMKSQHSLLKALNKYLNEAWYDCSYQLVHLSTYHTCVHV